MKIRLRIMLLVLVIAMWWIASCMTSPVFVPSPIDVVDEFVSLCSNGQMAMGFLYSFLRISIASLLSAMISIPLGMLMFYSKTARILIEPVTGIMRYLPITAFYPLLILWFGIGEMMKVSFLFIATFVYMLPSVVLAFEEISPELVLTSRTLGMSRFQIVKMVLLPSTLPSILQTFAMMYGIGWTYIAVCEQINAKYGIGFIIYTSSARGRTAIVFAGIIAIVIFSSLFDFISNKILKRCFKWRYVDAPIE